MPLIRGHHSFDDHYTQIPNAWLRDRRLSYRAAGILAEIMSHKVGWNIGIRTLANRAKEGIDAIRVAVIELEKLGYLERYQTRENNAFSEVVWRTCDPCIPVDSLSSDFPSSENPSSENPTTKKNITKNTKEPVKKLSTFPDSFSVTESMFTWAAEKASGLDIALETEKFELYHSSKNSKFADWSKAWMNWMLNAKKWAKTDNTGVDPWAGKRIFGDD